MVYPACVKKYQGCRSVFVKISYEEFNMRKSIVIVSLILLFAAAVPLHALMWANESCVAFPNGCLGGGGGKSGVTIGGFIAEGGYYFLKSSSDMDLFLSLIESSELSGPDYKAMETAINSAVFNMGQAKNIYSQLKDLAAFTSYDQNVISKLIEFDYVDFQKQGSLNPTIFDRVANHLGRGDVRGIYSESYLCLAELLEILKSIKKDTESNVLPDLSTLWRANQKFSETKMFGQYVTEVFYSLK